MILCVAANPSIDRLFTVEELVPGSIHRPAEFAQVPGGKGLNVARAAATLGGDVCAAALLGGHAGRWIAQQLEEESVPLEATWAAAETRSSLSVAGALEGLTEFYEHGLPVTAAEWAAFAELVTGLARRAAWMTLSGSLPIGAPADGYHRLAGLTRVAFDTREAGLDAAAGHRQAERCRGRRTRRPRTRPTGPGRSPRPPHCTSAREAQRSSRAARTAR